VDGHASKFPLCIEPAQNAAVLARGRPRSLAGGSVVGALAQLVSLLAVYVRLYFHNRSSVAEIDRIHTTQQLQLQSRDARIINHGIWKSKTDIDKLDRYSFSYRHGSRLRAHSCITCCDVRVFSACPTYVPQTQC